MSNETRQTATISLPPEMMEYVKNNGENVSKFLQALIGKCMDEYDPFNSNNAYDKTSRSLLSKSLALMDVYISNKCLPRNIICLEVTVSPVDYVLHISSHPSNTSESASDRVKMISADPVTDIIYELNTNIALEKNGGRIHADISFKTYKTGQLNYHIELSSSESLYSDVMKMISKYATVLAEFA